MLKPDTDEKPDFSGDTVESFAQAANNLSSCPGFFDDQMVIAEEAKTGSDAQE